MTDKKLILSTLFAFGFGCIVIGQMLWNVAHYWGTWKALLYGALGILNVTTCTFLVRSHLKWFDSRVAVEYSNGRLDAMREELLRRAEHE